MIIFGMQPEVWVFLLPGTFGILFILVDMLDDACFRR